MDLFTYPHRPGHVRTDTSRAAADAIAPTAGTLRAKVFDIIRAHGDLGLTDEELINLTRLNPSTARPRRRELEIQGHVKDSGKRRKTASGRDAVVWVAA